MLITESRAGRRLIGRLDRGVNLFDALLGVCRERGVRTGEIRAVGALETVEVAAYDQAAKSWKPGRSFAGGLEVLHLAGNVSERGGQLALSLHATLMREGDNGVEILGGHVLAGRVFALEFVIDAFDDVILRRTSDAATGLAQWSEAMAAGAAPPAAPAAPPAAERPPATTWADVARVSDERRAPPAATPAPPPARARPPEPEAEEAEDALEAGDVLIHPTFGRCEVQRVEGNYEFAQVRLKNGRLVRLSLDILKVVPAGMEGKQRVFRARVDD